MNPDDIEHTQSVLEDRITGLPAEVAMTAMLRLITKMADGMNMHERVRAAVLVAHYGGKIASSAVNARDV